MNLLRCLLMGQSASDLPEQLLVELKRCGAHVSIVDSPYEAVALLATEPFDILLVGVDYFGKEEFRLFPLVKGQWPNVVVVAYASDGFGHKCEMATILGADARCLGPEQFKRLNLSKMKDEQSAFGEAEPRGVQAVQRPMPAARGGDVVRSETRRGEPEQRHEDIVTPEELKALLEGEIPES